jgi:ribonuclease P protein component
MPPRRYTIHKQQRVRNRLEFSAVFDRGVRVPRGPLLLVGMPSERDRSRLGLSVPKRVGTAPTRNRVKRMLRECFRLMQHDLPRAYDLVVVVRPHKAMILAEYQRLLSGMVVKLHQTWEKRTPPPPLRSASQ